MCAMEPQQQQVKPSRWAGKECSMCGDVGFQKQLLRCTSCRQRYQHRYCSSLYPNALTDESHWVCDWCIAKQPRSSPKPKQDPSSSHQLLNRHLVQDREQAWTTATRSFPSPLDCLLEVAESTLNRENLQQQKQHESKQLKKTLGISPSMKKSSSMQALRKDGHTNPMVDKRKRCADLDIPSKPEIFKHKPNINNNSINNPTTPAKPPSGNMHFSPSKAVVGRRYRLLSEVLC